MQRRVYVQSRLSILVKLKWGPLRWTAYTKSDDSISPKKKKKPSSNTDNKIKT